jgi:hypothetical protein
VFKQLIVVLACVSASTSLHGQPGPDPGPGTRARAAAKVVVARILDVRGQFESNRFGDRLIVSHAVLEVLETWKGTSQPVLNMAIEGGTVGDLTLRVSDLPSLEKGERAVLFLDAAGNGEYVPHGRGHGVALKLTEDDRVRGTARSLNDVRDEVADAVRGRGPR